MVQIDWLSGTGYILVIATVVGLLALVLLWWVYNKNQYRFIFHLYSRDMKNVTYIKGRIKRDKTNKKFRYYAFKDNDTRLEIEDPDFFSNGKPVRRITFDSTGDYVYIKGIEIDDKEYLKYRLKPTHKTLYLHGLKDNANKYPMFDKGVMLAFAGLIIIGIFIVVGFIYTFASTIDQANQLIEIQKQSSDNIAVISSTAKSIETSAGSIYQATALLYNGTVVRPLPAVSP